MKELLIQNAKVVFGHQSGWNADVFIFGNHIEKIGQPRSIECFGKSIIDATGLYLFPGVIECHVHGFNHRTNLSKSGIAVAEGVTSCIEMYNPSFLKDDNILQEKNLRAERCSLVNYSFKVMNLGVLLDFTPEKSLSELIEQTEKGNTTSQEIAQRLSNNPATKFDIRGRGFIREGYFADLVLVNPNESHKVDGVETKVTHTFVNGHLTYMLHREGFFDETYMGKKLTFKK